MSTLIRLRDFTADRDSIPPIAISAEGMDNELDQIVTESNTQDGRITSAEGRLTTLEAPGNVAEADLADDAVTPAKASFIDDALVATDTHIMVGDGTDFGNVAVSGDATIDNTGALTIANDAVTTAKMLDANVTLAKLQNATATNKILGRVSSGVGGYEEVTLETNLTSTDEAIPTSKAVRDDIVSLVNDVGGFVAVADELSFPNTNPDPDDGAGTVVSIANAGGLVVDGSGVTTTGRTLGGTTVTITGVSSNFHSTTISDGLGMQVITTTTLNTYTFHRVTAKEVDLSTVSTNIGNVNITGAGISNINTVAGQISPTNNIGTLAGIDSDITVVSGISSDVQTVSSANSNISTCATNISGINSFGERYRVQATAPTTDLDQGDLWYDTSNLELKSYGTSWQNTAPSTVDQNNINIVAGDVVHAEDMGSITDALTTSSGNGDITTCATNITNIGLVADNSTNLNLVGNSITNVNLTGGSIAAVQSVSGSIASVNSVHTNIASVNTCAADISKIVDTANDLNEAVSEIDTCATNIANINLCGNDIANINAVAADATDIGVVAGQSTEIGLLGTAGNVTAMSNLGSASVIADLSTCSTNVSDISTVAGISAGVNFFSDRYRVQALAPTTSLDSGDLWWDETNSELRAYSGSAWQSTAPSAVNQTHINNVSGAIVYAQDNGLITDALSTSSTSGDIATCSNNIDEIARLGTAQAVSDLQSLGSATNVAHLQTVSGSIANIQTVSGSISDVNRYAEEYTINGSAPGSPSAGDLWYDSSTNVLKYRTDSAWASLTAGIAEISQDTTPTLGGNLDCDSNSLSNVGTIDGSSLALDFGTL